MYCTKCGKEIADDSRFCTSCGVAINKTMSLPISERPLPPRRRKIRTSWIVIGVLVIVAIIAMIVDRNAPENKAARLACERSEMQESNEKPVTWSDVKKSWADAKKAKQDLDKSVGALKDEWNDFKKEVKDAVDGVDTRDLGDSDPGEAKDGIKNAVKESNVIVESALDDKELKAAADELKAALQD